MAVFSEPQGKRILNEVGVQFQFSLSIYIRSFLLSRCGVQEVNENETIGHLLTLLCSGKVTRKPVYLQL